VARRDVDPHFCNEPICPLQKLEVSGEIIDHDLAPAPSESTADQYSNYQRTNEADRWMLCDVLLRILNEFRHFFDEFAKILANFSFVVSLDPNVARRYRASRFCRLSRRREAFSLGS
jgi:hypothetical protein